jgi:hypothetical protein
VSAQRFHPLEPRITVAELRPGAAPTWEAVGRAAPAILGRDCLGLPSARVGLGWALEYLGTTRHRDHVLVPKFVGRCILNSLSRYALPVERPTPSISHFKRGFGGRTVLAPTAERFFSTALLEETFQAHLRAYVATGAVEAVR